MDYLTDDKDLKREYELRKNKIISLMKVNVIIILILIAILGFTFFILNRIFNDFKNIELFYLVFMITNLIFFSIVIPLPTIMDRLESQYKEKKLMFAYEEFLLMFYIGLGKIPKQVLRHLKIYFAYPDEFQNESLDREKEYKVKKRKLYLILRSLIGSIIYIFINVSILISLLSKIPSFGIILIPIVMEIFKIYKLVIVIIYIFKLKKEYNSGEKLTKDREYFTKYIAQEKTN